MKPVVIIGGAAYALHEGTLWMAALHQHQGAHLVRLTVPPPYSASQTFPGEWFEARPLCPQSRAALAALQVLTAAGGAA